MIDENILAEGQLLYGNSNYYETLINALEFKPYQIINSLFLYSFN